MSRRGRLRVPVLAAVTTALAGMIFSGLFHAAGEVERRPRRSTPEAGVTPVGALLPPPTPHASEPIPDSPEYDYPVAEIESAISYLPSLTPVPFATPSPAPEPTPRAAIVCEGDRVCYRDNGKMIVAEGNVRIGYKNMELTADRITVYVDRKEAYAEGNVTLIQGTNVITSDQIRYDFIKEKGLMSPGSGYYAPWYGRAETVDSEGREKVTFISGDATTDDYDDPDYRLEAGKFIIYPDDKIVAHNIVVYVGSVPILWMPYYRRSLKDNCRGFFFYPGYRNSWGFFFLSGYHWCAPGINTTFHLDYRYRRGLAYGFDGRFYLGDSGRGEWQTYYLQDRGYEEDDGGITTRERYLIEFNYRQNLFYRIGGYLSLHYLSDADIRKDFFRREYDADSQPESYIYLDRRWNNITLSVKVRPRLNKFYTVTEKLPEAKVQIQQFQIGESDFYYQGENSFTSFRKIYAHMGSALYESSRFDTFHQISYSKKFFGWLNFYPATSIRGDYYSRGPGKTEEEGAGAEAGATTAPTPETTPTPPPDPTDRRDFWRRVFSYSVGVSTDIYGIFPAQNDWLEIYKLRHVITPSINYIFTDNPSVYYEDIYQFDSIDKIYRRNYFQLGFRNQLQTKRIRGSGEESWTLIDLILSTNLYTKPDRDNYGRLIGDLDGELEITPFSWLGFDLKQTYNTYDNQFKESTLNAWVRPEDNWWFTFYHNYRRAKDRNRVSGEVYFRINPIWAFKVYGRYDTVEGRFEEESFTIYRDLHSWSSYLRFQYQNAEEEFSVYLALWIKAFSQTPLNLSN